MSDYTERVEHNLKGLEAVSSGICPGCQECADTWTDGDLEHLKDEWPTGGFCDEGSFSKQGCSVCGNPLGNTLFAWHAILDGEIVHFDDMCPDCVMYLANGDEPEE